MWNDIDPNLLANIRSATGQAAPGAAPAPAAAAQPAAPTAAPPPPKMISTNLYNGRAFDQYNTQYDASGRPIATGLETGRDNNGNLLSQYQVKDQGAVTADRSALDAMKSRALSSGASPWAQMQLQQQGIQQAQAGDQAAHAAQAQKMAGMSQLAQSGGMGAGSRERLAKSSMANNLMAQQGVNRAGEQAKLNIGIQDDQAKMGLLNAVQSGENTQAGIGMQNRAYSTGVDQINKSAALNDLGGANAYNQNNYNQAMQSWAAQQTSNAMNSNAGRPGGGGLMGGLGGALAGSVLGPAGQIVGGITGALGGGK